jgi:hypothetical protein
MVCFRYISVNTLHKGDHDDDDDDNSVTNLFHSSRRNGCLCTNQTYILSAIKYYEILIHIPQFYYFYTFMRLAIISQLSRKATFFFYKVTRCNKNEARYSHVQFHSFRPNSPVFHWFLSISVNGATTLPIPHFFYICQSKAIFYINHTAANA